MTTLVQPTDEQQILKTGEALHSAGLCSITKQIADTITINGCENVEYYEFLNTVEPIRITPSERAKIIVLSPHMFATINPPPDETEQLKKDKAVSVGFCIFLIIVIILIIAYFSKTQKK